MDKSNTENKIFIKMYENNSDLESDSEDNKNNIPRLENQNEETDSEDFKCIIPLEENNSEGGNSDEDFKDILHYEQPITMMNSLPDRSKEKYLKEYSLFKTWCEEKKFIEVTEDVILSYFLELAKAFKSSSLWVKYSMLKMTLAIKDNVDIKSPKILAFLKRQSVGHKARKSETFTRDDINKFLTEAPDQKYLMTKVALIMGVTGGCRCQELTRMKVDDIQDQGSILIVKVPDAMTGIHRTFVVDGETSSGLNFVEIYRKYLALRSPKTNHRRLFVNYHDGKCTVQVVGKNTISKIPVTVAKFLKKPNHHAYTGHCLRKTSAKLFVDSGRNNVLNLKRLARWSPPRSNEVEGGVESKRQAIDTETCKEKTKESEGTSANEKEPEISSSSEEKVSFSFKSLGDEVGVTVHNANNCTFIININKCECKK